MKFELSAQITVSAYTTVEAETYEEAFKIAARRGAAIRKHHLIEELEQWIINEADGLPCEIAEVTK